MKIITNNRLRNIVFILTAIFVLIFLTLVYLDKNNSVNLEDGKIDCSQFRKEREEKAKSGLQIGGTLEELTHKCK